MSRRAHLVSILVAFVAIACTGGERASQDRQAEVAAEPVAVERAADPTVGAAESSATSTSPGSSKERSETAEAGAVSGAGKPDAGDVSPAAPGRVAPVAEGDEPGLKNWLLIEFARAIEPSDLEWLEQSGFRVDTLMNATTVRGWLEDAAGGAVIGKDPRVVRIDAQMR